MAQQPTRNTLNQRASRARRREYVATLESRLSAYEEQGVQATTELQNAARRVADENRLLRVENAVLRREVETLRREVAALKGHGSVWKGGPPPSPQNRLSVPVIDQRYPSPPSDRVLLSAPSQSVPGLAIVPPTRSPTNLVSSPANSTLAPASNPSPNNYEHFMQLMSSFQNLLPPGLKDTDSRYSQLFNSRDPSWESQHSQSELQPHSHHSSLSPDSSPGPSSAGHSRNSNSTSCMHAARIIADMRGSESADAILPELGCEGGEGDVCAVDNVRLFSVMDTDR